MAKADWVVACNEEDEWVAAVNTHDSVTEHLCERGYVIMVYGYFKDATDAIDYAKAMC